MAAQHLYPGDSVGWIERLFYRNLTRASHWLFMRFAGQEIALMRMRMAQDECKHDKAGPDSTFCPQCGKQLGADPEVDAAIERTVRRVLSEFDVKPKKPAGGGGKGDDGKETKKSLADKLGLSKK